MKALIRPDTTNFEISRLGYKMPKYILILTITACHFLSEFANAQTSPGCAWGTQSLSRHLEANQAGVRTITVCPGAAAEICVHVDSGYRMSINIDSSGTSTGNFTCQRVTRRSCDQVPIRLANPYSDALGFQISCTNID